MTYFEHLSDRFDFGKFNGRTLGEVLTFSPSYITWVVYNVSGSVCKISDTAIEEIKTVFPNLNISEEFERQRHIQLQGKDGFIDEDHYDNSYSEDDFEPTYDRYNGSYAQDEMEYSDDEIDTIFDGDPLAYWNID